MCADAVCACAMLYAHASWLVWPAHYYFAPNYIWINVNHFARCNVPLSTIHDSNIAKRPVNLHLQLKVFIYLYRALYIGLCVDCCIFLIYTFIFQSQIQWRTYIDSPRGVFEYGVCPRAYFILWFVSRSSQTWSKLIFIVK